MGIFANLASALIGTGPSGQATQVKTDANGNLVTVGSGGGGSTAVDTELSSAAVAGDTDTNDAAGGVRARLMAKVPGADQWGRILKTPTGDGVVSGPAARIARSVHLASAALPAAGAFTSQTAFTILDGVRSINFYVTYTQGAGGGYPLLRFESGNGTETGGLVVIDGAIAVTDPFGQRTAYIDRLKGPVPADGSALTYMIPWRVSGGETTVRLLMAEGGATGTPGTAAIAITAQYGS